MIEAWRLWRRMARVRLGLAAIFAAALGAVLLPAPPGFAQGGVDTTTFFGALASGAIVAVAVLPLGGARGVRRPVAALIAVVALAVGGGSFAAARSFEHSCTARHESRTVVVGTELTPLGIAYTRANPDASREQLLSDAAGVPQTIWTSESIGLCRVKLATSYYLWLPFLIVSVFAGTHAVRGAPTLAARPSPVVSTSGQAAPVTRYDLFVSYRHGSPDRDIARELVEALESEGYRAAIDERDFAANGSFLQEMERCIRESRFTLAIVSSRYLASDNCQEEAILCKVLDMDERKRRLIPFVIEPVAMPGWLYGIVGVHATTPEPLVEPVEKLKATLGTPLRDQGLGATV